MICPHGLAAAKVHAKRWATRVDLHTCVESSKRFLTDHMTERAVVERAAAHVGLSRAHFIRLFHTSTGVSPRDFVAARRIGVAKERLITGESTAQVAQAVGYQDAEAFRRAFVRLTGQTPSEFTKFARSNGSG